MPVYGLNVQPVGFLGRAEPLDGFDAPIPALDPVNDGGVGWSGRTGGVPVDGTHFPKRARWMHPRRQRPSDFESVPSFNLSERAKAVIEDMEPGVHQFFPVDFVDGKDALIERRYWLVVCRRLDTVDREHTTLVLRKGQVWRIVSDLVRRGEPIPPHLSPDVEPKLVFNLSAIGDAHLWVDKHLDGGAQWISEAMAARLTTEGLTGLKLESDGAEAV